MLSTKNDAPAQIASQSIYSLPGMDAPQPGASTPRPLSEILQAYGLKAFRLKRGTKHGFIDSDWAKDAGAAHRRAVDALASGNAAAFNFAVNAGASEVVVVDIDTKGANAGRDPWDVAHELGLPETFAVETPSGGLHLYYAANGQKFSQRALAPNVDVRAGKGFVVAPGSEVGGKPYRVVRDLQPASVPPVIAERQGKLAEAPTSAGDHEPPVNAHDGWLRAAAALWAIPPTDDRDTWLRVGMMLHGLGEPGFELWAQWSEASAKFDPEDQRKVWGSFKTNSGGALTLGSLFHMARQHGWTDASRSVLSAVPEVEATESEGQVLPYSLVWAAESAPNLNPSYVVKGLFAPGDLVALYGPSNAGKTFIALDLAYRIAHGQMAFGRRVNPGSVLYLSAEGNTGIGNRVAVLNGLHGDPGRNFARMISNVNLSQAGGHAEASVSAIIRAAQEMGDVSGRGVRLIILDTLARVMAGDDENSNRDIALVVKRAERIARETGAAVLLVHHSGKDATKGMRGGYSLFAACECVLSLAGGVVDAEKVRDGSTGSLTGYTLNCVALGTDTDGDPVTTCTVAYRVLTAEDRKSSSLSAAESAVLRIVTEGGLIAREEALVRFRSAAVVNSGSEDPRKRGAAERQAFGRALGRLIEKGLLVLKGDVVAAARLTAVPNPA